MRVVICPDKFAGTLSAPEAADCVAAGWAQVSPNDELTRVPLADGGPGFLDVISAAIPGERVAVPARDPLGRPIDAEFFLAAETGHSAPSGSGSDGAAVRRASDVTDGERLRLRLADAAGSGASPGAGGADPDPDYGSGVGGSGRAAYLESAQACGLHLLPKAERDPKLTTSYGLGMLISAAVEAGARRIVIGLGGSAVNDGGAGLLAALGAPALDGAGEALPHGGAALLRCQSLGGVPGLRGARLVAATDVDNPLLGLHGASAVFGPQKSATRDDVMLLDRALEQYAQVLRRSLPGCPDSLEKLPGAGAAGGLGAAIYAMGGTRESGIDLIKSLAGFDAVLDGADLVITGEGSFDFQSLRGKVAAGVAEAASQRGAPCVVLAGQVSVGRREALAAGIAETYSVAEHVGSAEQALRAPRDGLRSLAARVARQWSR